MTRLAEDRDARWPGAASGATGTRLGVRPHLELLRPPNLLTALAGVLAGYAAETTIHVGFRYPVHFTHDVFAPRNPLLRNVVARGPAPATLLAVVDDGVSRQHPRLLTGIARYCHWYGLRLAGPPLVLPGGEAVKNDPPHLGALHAAMETGGLCRQSYCLAIGGGAVLDVAGYAAATAQRGIRLIRVPTTARAQGAAGVGVKNGINAFGKKNFLSVFAPPFAVLNDAAFLATARRP